MTAHILSTVGDIECTITVGSGACYHTVQDGTIIIRTATDSITIQPRHIVDREILARDASSKGAPQEDGVDSNRANSGDPTGSTGIEEHTEYDQEEGINVTNDDSSRTEDSDPEGEAQRRKEEIEQLCKKLEATIQEKWEAKSKTWEQEKEELLADHATFFGKCTSQPQWSYQSLASSENTIHVPFHKLNLHFWWSQSKGVKHSQKWYQTLIPGYAQFDQKKRESTRVRVTRYVKQGEVLRMMCNHTQGLLITVPEYMRSEDFELLLKHKNNTYVSNLDWIPKDLLAYSKAFSTIVDGLLESYFPDLSYANLQTPKQVTSKPVNDSGTRKKTRDERSKHALKRQRWDSRSESHAPSDPESALGIASPIVGTTSTITSAGNQVPTIANSTRKRQRIGDGDEQVRNAVPAVDAGNHNSPAPQTSRQDGPEHLPPPILPSPTSEVIGSLSLIAQEVIDGSATTLTGSCEEGSTLSGSTRQTSPPFEGTTFNNESTAATLTATNVKPPRTEDSQPPYDDNANLQDMYTSPTEGEQVRDAVADVDAGNHNSPAPQTSGQDGPEYSRLQSLLSPTSEVISSGEEFHMAGSTGHISPPSEGITFNAFKVTLPTADVDSSSTNDEETRVEQSIGGVSTLEDPIHVGFNLDSYLPDRESEKYIEDWEKVWGFNCYEQTAE